VAFGVERAEDDVGEAAFEDAELFEAAAALGGAGGAGRAPGEQSLPRS